MFLSKRRLFASKTNNVSCIINIPSSPELERIKKEVSENISDIIKVEDEPHVTLVYAGDVPINNIQKAVELIKEKIKGFKIDLTLGPIETMENADGETVLYLNADHEKLSGMHFALRGKLKELGGNFKYKSFKSHMTIAYKNGPLSDKEKEFIKDLKTDIEVCISEANANVSKKENEKWIKLAEELGIP